MKQPGLHIFTARKQPAVRFKVDVTDKPFWIKIPGNRLLHTDCCRMLRPAKNLLAQVYYDTDYFWCKPGKGCKKGKK